MRDLVVVGGGLAGVCGAIAARSLGLSAAIVQDRPVFGGNASSEIRVHINGAGRSSISARETGIICELFLKERRSNFSRHRSSLINSVLDMVLYDALREEGVEIFLNTSCRRAVMKTDSLISGAYCVQTGSEKEFTVEGRYFLDASGDGALAFSAGADYRQGREGKAEFGESLAPEKPDAVVQGSSLLFLVRDCGKPVEFKPPSWSAEYPEDSTAMKLRAHSGMPGYWWIEIGCPFDTVSDNEQIKHQLLSHLMGVWDHLKNRGNHGFENFSLEWVGTVPGKRESRRFMGDYILKERDLREKPFFPDSVAYGGWYIDLHTPGGILAGEEYPEPTQDGDIKKRDSRAVSLYPIPYRCLYSRNIKNLFLAGRNISATHVALGSTRVMGTCALLGQAAGTAAYVCSSEGIMPGGIYPRHIKKLQQQLIKDGCFIPGVVNEDAGDLMRKAGIMASSHMPMTFPARGDYIRLNVPRGQAFPFRCGKLGTVTLPLKSETSGKLRMRLRKAEGIRDFSSEKDIAVREAAVGKGESSAGFKFDLKLDTGIYWIFLEKNRRVWLQSSTETAPGQSELEKPGARWHPRTGRRLCMEITPAPRPYPAGNIISGVSRPEKKANAWISDPSEKFPQFLQIDFKKPVGVNHIRIIFDSDLELENLKMPPFFVPPSIARELKVFAGAGSRKLLAHVKDNREYLLDIKFPPTRTGKLKIEFVSANGGRNIGVYEIRAYMDKTGRDEK